MVSEVASAAATRAGNAEPLRRMALNRRSALAPTSVDSARGRNASGGGTAGRAASAARESAGVTPPLVTVDTNARPSSGITVPPFPPRAETAVPPFDVRRAISRLRSLTSEERDDANEHALSESSDLLPRMLDRADSGLVLYYQARAHANLGQRDAACASLAGAERLVRGLPLANEIIQTRGALSCP